MSLVVRSPRSVLRPFREADLATLAAYRSDPEVARYQGWTPPFTMDDARDFLRGLQAVRFGTPGTWYQLALADPATDAVMGDCALHFLEDHRQVEIGFTLARPFQGRGLMREAVTALLDQVFGPLRKHRVIAITDARNESAHHLLDRLGFRKEGHFLKNIFFKGEWGDEMQHACLAEEWLARRPASAAVP